jgi:hypothetical protein
MPEIDWFNTFDGTKKSWASFIACYNFAQMAGYNQVFYNGRVYNAQDFKEALQK